ncbi:MAG: hypothetical protein H6822_07975 [Planctomycetaceae bacterium]|nr:hypothetical protein [Planctomycetales bacterium]MCB9922104.1 hypothetical protein [Planctomycetaceae bacterium]
MRHTRKTAAFLTILLASVGFGQEGQPRENVTASGVIKGVRPGVLAVLTEQGEQWLVKIPDRPQDISFVASANPNWLRPGMLVKFKNTFDAKGRPAATVRQLEVITLRPDTQLGLIPDSQFGGGATGLFSSEEPAKKQSAPETMSFTVAGTLRGFKDGNLLVAAGNMPVQSQLDERATISVDVSDYSLAREGDTVELTGWYYLGHRDRVFSNRLSISSKEKLGMEEGKEKKVPTKKEPATKDDVEKALEDLFSS